MPKNYASPEKIKLSKDDILSEMSFNILPSLLTINPYNPDDLITKKGLYTYDKMKDDEAVKVALLIKKTVMLSNNITLEPASSDPKDIEIKEFVDYNLFKALKRPFKSSLEEVLSAIDYGYSVTEQIFYYIEKGKFKGKIGLKDLKTRPPHGFDFKQNALGDIISLVQFQGQGMYSQELPASKFLIHTFNKQFDNPYGNADLRAVYRPWWCKDVCLKFYAIHLERYGTPLLIAYYTGQLNTDENKDLKNILTYLLKGTSFKLPEGKVRIDKLDFQPPTGYEVGLDRFDKMITRGLLMPDQLGFTNTSSGAYNLGLSQFDLFYLINQKFLGTCLEDVDNQIIKPLVNLNYETDAYPKLKSNSLNNEELDKLANIYNTLTNTGYMNPQNKEDLDFVRDKYNLPKVNQLSKDKSNSIYLSASKNQKILNDMIKVENDMSELITKKSVDLSEKEYANLIKAYADKEYEQMQEILEGAGIEDLTKMLNEFLTLRFEAGMNANK